MEIRIIIKGIYCILFMYASVGYAMMYELDVKTSPLLDYPHCTRIFSNIIAMHGCQKGCKKLVRGSPDYINSLIELQGGPHTVSMQELAKIKMCYVKCEECREAINNVIRTKNLYN